MLGASLAGEGCGDWMIRCRARARDSSTAVWAPERVRLRAGPEPVRAPRVAAGGGGGGGAGVGGVAGWAGAIGTVGDPPRGYGAAEAAGGAGLGLGSASLWA